MKPIHFTPILLTVSLMVSSCNMAGPATESPGAVSTAAAETVQAVLTSTATSPATQALATVAVTPTPTSAATCNDSATHTAWNRDGVIYDVTAVNTPLAPDKPFVMSWTLQNTGDCTWDNTYHMSYESGTSMTETVIFPILEPGQTLGPGESVTVDVEMTTPGEAGDYEATWQLQKDQDPSLISFGIVIKVGSASSSPLARPANLTYTYDCTTGVINVSLSWTDLANGEDGYRIYRDGTEVAELPSGSTSYDGIAPSAGTYVYKVAAFNLSGESSAQVTVNTANCE